MSVAASRPPAPVAAPVPVPVPPSENREPGSPAFAELLRQQRGVAPHAQAQAALHDGDVGAARTEHEPASESMAASTDESALASDGPPRSDAARARARGASTSRHGAARASGPAEPIDRPAATSTEREAQVDDDIASDASGAAAHPAHGVRPDARPDAALRLGGVAQRLAAAAGAADDAGAGSSGRRALSDVGGSTEAPGRSHRAGSEAAGRADAGRDSASSARNLAAESRSASFTQVLADKTIGERPAPAAAGSSEPALLPGGVFAAAESRMQATAESAAATHAGTLPVPVDSPDFAAAFGVQVSVLVQGGVQQAELHLNPAETGPVSIAITLEGNQAHVEFGADLAATRQAIENGLPALASALRDAGFTLAGGGVSQHSRSRTGGDDDRPADGERRQRRGAEPAGATALPRTHHRVNAGGIDLYA